MKMMRGFRQLIAACTITITAAYAADILDELTVNGVTYHNVKWGPVNNGKVTIIHNKGVANLKLEDLPPGLQTPFPYTPKAPPDEPPLRPSYRPPPEPTTRPVLPPPPPQPKTPEQLRLETEAKEYDVVRATKVLYEGRLVEKNKLTAITGFVRNPDIEFPPDQDPPTGTWLELAVKRPDAPTVAAQFDLRPGLWKGSGDFALLQDYETDTPTGLLIRVYGTETKRVSGHRAFLIGTEPTFAEWQKLREPTTAEK